VIPRIKQDSIRWILQGEQAARQGLLSRGVLPLLAGLHREVPAPHVVLYIIDHAFLMQNGIT
jgi:hypothetical protein